MLYRLLADGLALVHFGFVLFVVGGGLLALRWRWVPWVHLPAAAWGAFVELSGRICPLTPLENALRRAGGAAGYEGGFVERYLLPVLYPADLTREVQIVLGAVVVACNAAIYLAVWLRRRAASRRSRGGDA
ncbi:MAG: DUF2784 domain-containing protein [Thermoanaerobaculia bacterium]|nr:DUF2784 domain-containing protein [Thermoanaerobaculia bacterium]